MTVYPKPSRALPLNSSRFTIDVSRFAVLTLCDLCVLCGEIFLSAVFVPIAHCLKRRAKHKVSIEKNASYLLFFLMSDELKKASLLLRVFAKALDFILIAAVTEMVPKAGFYAGLSYLLISDGLFDGRSLGKRLMGLRVVSAGSGIPCSMRQSIVRNVPLGAGLYSHHRGSGVPHTPGQ
jgi:hypothetical protein